MNRISTSDYLATQIFNLKQKLEDPGAPAAIKEQYMPPLATYLTCAGQYSEAIAIYENRLSTSHNYAIDLRIGLAHCLLQAGELAGAEAEINSISNLGGGFLKTSLEVTKLKAKLLFFQGNWLEAFKGLNTNLIKAESLLPNQEELNKFRRRSLELFELKSLILLNLSLNEPENVAKLTLVEELLKLRNEFDSFLGSLNSSAYQRRLKDMRELIYEEFIHLGGIDEDEPTVPATSPQTHSES